MNVDPTSHRPIFQQIADGLRQAIAAGVFQPGEPVPSIRAQAIKLRINPNTIKRAYEELQRDGIIEARAGVGLFVTAGSGASAKSRTAKDVKEAIARAVRRGLGAGLSRAQIDGAYAAAWREEKARPDGKGGAEGAGAAASADPGVVLEGEEVKR